ncbi:chaperone protein dnaJ 11, chloroplastic [Malania oleifera]|uniref:chaperone protein dnaJ 11, chloroplastic n=1 Tax=Malania oleifera TaxID=397392 RepID=UPI0025ADF6B6|nr:chaperone protein dnaJ 11, chloroplastic [Malania oleifera]
MFGVLTLPAAPSLRFAGSRREKISSSPPARWTPCKASAAVVDARRPTTSLYEVLRVTHDASPLEIKAAYRTLAKLYHPDASSESDGRDFIEIHNAYATLSDPAARAHYDLSLGVGPGGRRRPFAYSSSSSSVDYRSGFYTSRRWETDQCW